MFKVLKDAAVMGVTACFLAGCTDNGLLFRSFGGYEETDQVTYKIGEAYQIKNEWYTPKEDYSYSEKGVAGWYQEEQGKLTANGEKYDEEALTAMHKTLPLPSIVRITNLENGNVAIVRVNDRGPFVNNRLIDVSQKTAEALEFNMVGTTMVQVDILPGESRQLKAEILKKHGGQMEEVNVSGESVLNSQVEMEDLSDQPKPLYQPDEGEQVIYGAQNLTGTSNGAVSGITSVTQPIEEAVPTAQTVTTRPPIEPMPANESTVQNTITTPKLVAPISGHYVQAGAFSNMENAQKLKNTLEQFGPVQIYDTEINGAVLHRVRMGPFETREGAVDLQNKILDAGFGETKIIFEP